MIRRESETQILDVGTLINTVLLLVYCVDFYRSYVPVIPEVTNNGLGKMTSVALVGP